MSPGLFFLFIMFHRCCLVFIRLVFYLCIRRTFSIIFFHDYNTSCCRMVNFFSIQTQRWNLSRLYLQPPIKIVNNIPVIICASKCFYRNIDIYLYGHDLLHTTFRTLKKEQPFVGVKCVLQVLFSVLFISTICYLLKVFGMVLIKRRYLI